MSSTYAEAAKQAEEAALKAAGISTQSEDEIALEYVNNKISAFKEQQFAAWCAANGISYSNDTEKEVALQKYKEAAATDSANFTDGIWTPDDASRNLYKALLKEKADIQYNGDVATAAAHLKYVEGIATAAAEIQAREGSWNQDPGHQLSAAELGLAGGSDYSAVANSGSAATTSTVTVEDVFEVTAYTADGGINGEGVTATGEDLKNKTIDVHVIAVDPDVIPLHTVVNMHFHSSEWQKYDGDYRALDTGGAIKGKIVDLFIGYGERELAMKFGRQQATLKWNKPGVANTTGVETVSVDGVEKMIQWALQTAADQTHGYSMSSRTGPDYDCSSFVSYALKAGGFDVIAANNGYPPTAATLWNALEKVGGWVKHSFSSVSVQRGDILIRANEHAAIAISSTKTVEASGVNSGQGSPETGDQGREIDQYNVTGRTWHEVYRHKDATVTVSSPAGTSGSGGDIEKAVRWAEAQKGKAYASVDNIPEPGLASKRDGPDAYDCSSLVYWALQNAGFDIQSAWKKNKRYSATGPVSDDGSTGGYGGKQKMGDADTIWQDIQTMGSQGWENKSYTSTTPKRGDILYRHNTHCGFAVSATKSIEAKGKDYGIDNFDISATAWTHIYRYTAPAISQPAQGTTAQTGIGVLLTRTKTAQLTNQIMLVVCSNGTNSYQCTFSFWEKSGSMWVQKLSTNQGKGGSAGFMDGRWVGSKKSPFGSFPITYAFGHLPNPGTALTYHQTDRSSWVDINDQFNGPAGGGESVGSEQYDGAYDYAAVIGFNETSRKIGSTGTGSCIFLHCPSGAYGTSGCIAIPKNDMIKTLQLAKPGCWIIIAADVNSIANY